MVVKIRIGVVILGISAVVAFAFVAILFSVSDAFASGFGWVIGAVCGYSTGFEDGRCDP